MLPKRFSPVTFSRNAWTFTATSAPDWPWAIRPPRPNARLAARRAEDEEIVAVVETDACGCTPSR